MPCLNFYRCIKYVVKSAQKIPLDKSESAIITNSVILMIQRNYWIICPDLNYSYNLSNILHDCEYFSLKLPPIYRMFATISTSSSLLILHPSICIYFVMTATSYLLKIPPNNRTLCYDSKFSCTEYILTLK